MQFLIVLDINIHAFLLPLAARRDVGRNYRKERTLLDPRKVQDDNSKLFLPRPWPAPPPKKGQSLPQRQRPSPRWPLVIVVSAQWRASPQSRRRRSRPHESGAFFAFFPSDREHPPPCWGSAPRLTSTPYVQHYVQHCLCSVMQFKRGDRSEWRISSTARKIMWRPTI